MGFLAEPGTLALCLRMQNHVPGHGMSSRKCSLLVMNGEEATGRQTNGELPDAMGEILIFTQGEGESQIHRASLCCPVCPRWPL